MFNRDFAVIVISMLLKVNDGVYSNNVEMIVERDAQGDNFAYVQETSVIKCKEHSTVASKKHKPIRCMDYKDISHCSYGYNEYDSSGTPFIVSRNLCQGDITKVDVWDVKHGMGYWRSIGQHTENLLYKGDIYVQFREDANVTWEGLLLRLWLKCGTNIGCLMVKTYGTTNHPLPNDETILKRRKIITLENYLDGKQNALKDQNKTSTKVDVSSGIIRTKYHVTFLKILYYVMLTLLGIFILVVIILMLRRKKKKFYNITIRRKSSSSSHSRFSESFDLETRPFQKSHYPNTQSHPNDV